MKDVWIVVSRKDGFVAYVCESFKDADDFVRYATATGYAHWRIVKREVGEVYGGIAATTPTTA